MTGFLGSLKTLAAPAPPPPADPNPAGVGEGGSEPNESTRMGLGAPTAPVHCGRLEQREELEEEWPTKGVPLDEWWKPPPLPPLLPPLLPT